MNSNLRHYLSSNLFPTLVLSLSIAMMASGCSLLTPTTQTGTTPAATTPAASTTTTPATTPAQTTATTSQTSAPTTTAAAASVSDYFPTTPDMYFKYAGKGNEYMPMDVYVDYVRPGQIQLVENNGGTEVRKLYGVGNGVIQILQQKPELYVSEDLSLLSPLEDGEILLQEPLVAGTAWTVNGQKRQITAVDMPVQTPAGTFNAIEVTTSAPDVTTRQYYARGIGFIKMYTTGEYEVSQELEQIKEGTAAIKKQAMTFYYARMNQTGVDILYKEVTVKTRTNEGLKEVLTSYFRKPLASGLQPLISVNTVVQSVIIDQETSIVTIDFSPELITETSAGAEFESAIIRCIVNTVGHAYDVRKVIITLNGQLYASGHIALDPGDTFTVNYKNMIKLP